MYAVFIEPNWIEVTHHKVGARNDADAMKALHLSDLHLSDIGYRERRVLELSKELQPDVVVLSGDIVEAPSELPALDKFLSSLAGGIKVAVLGNWEHWGDVDLEALRQIYAARGVDLLVNEVKAYRLRNDRTLTVVGMDDFTAGKPDARVLHEIKSGNSATLLLQHSPGWFDHPEVRGFTKKFSLCLSGHTHGGQVALFGYPFWIPRGSGGYVAGMYETSSCPLYVSRGVGSSILPIRFGARPEIAILEL